MIPSDYPHVFEREPTALMMTPGAHQLFDALNGEARFVGGCVRDCLLGQTPGDIDIATPWQPSSVEKRLSRAGFSIHPIGIEHGTVLAVTPDRTGQFEVTTLRQDIETDGRHAVVKFTASYREDAKRRDLTFNALSMGPEGHVFDYFDGIADLRAGRVRFVGDPNQRIQEDYLRILRYFRFFARYGTLEPDAATLQALRDNLEGIRGLSGERLEAELSKMLVGPRAMTITQKMNDIGLLELIMGRPLDLEGFKRLIGLEGALGVPNVERRFAVLLSRSRARIDTLADRFKWPNRVRHRLRLMAQGELPPYNIETMIYRFGATTAQDWLVLTSVELNQAVNPELWALTQNWQPPKFPINGEDIMHAGVPHGPGVGDVRLELEEWWLAQGFAPGRNDLLERLSQIVGDRFPAY